jgi:hypothetical protein
MITGLASFLIAFRAAILTASDHCKGLPFSSLDTFWT